MDLHIKTKPFQKGFLESDKRFPAFVSGWGTGKTMFGIMRGLRDSKRYPNNLGLIVRKEFTDLRDSTLKDYELYTGRRVHSTKKEDKLANGSVIMFRHGKELSLLQNINLGWFVIEQAEEFDTMEQFQILRGRLRRKGVPHWGGVIANTKGHNYIWRLWKKKKYTDPEHGEFDLYEANSFESADYLPEDTIRDWRSLEKDDPHTFNRFVMNSWEDFDLEGSYYAKLMSKALTEGRITKVRYDDASLVHTGWDFGFGDSTAIWWFQLIGNEIHLIDYYENSGEGIAFYRDIIESKDYRYGEHFAPHDVQAGHIQTGITLMEYAKKVGLKFVALERDRDIEVGIAEVRSILNRCCFDAEKCEYGIECIENFRAEWDKKHECFRNRPLHNWASHGEAAFRSVAKAVLKRLSSSRMTAEEAKEIWARHRRP